MARHTYPVYTTDNGWAAMLAKRQPRPSLTGENRADHVVIGAGYTGLAMARRLAEAQPDARIALLEASVIDQGSASRNSGFTAGLNIPTAKTRAAAEQAEALNKLLGMGFSSLTDIISRHNIDIDLAPVGAMRGAATDAGEAGLRKISDIASYHGIRHEVLDSNTIARRTGSHYYRFGLRFPDTQLLQPAALVRGLVDTLPENITLYENTPVTSLHRDGAGWRVETASGSVRAKTVGLASNAFIRAFGYLKLRMAAIYTYAAVTEPIPASERAFLGEDAHWGLLPSHRLGSTLRRVGEDRLMVRSLYAYEKEVPAAKATAALRARFERRWPELAHRRFEFLWGGTTAFTMNGAPWWGQLDEGLFASGGCNGAGIAKGTVLGTLLADLALGKGDHASVRATFGVASMIPPEPFRSIGFQLISALESRKAGLES